MSKNPPNTYENYDPYGTYQTKGEDPYSLLLKMSAWNKGIRSTISEVQVLLDGTIERQSQIIQEVDRISIEVFDITTTLDGTVVRVADLEVRSDAIELNVTEADSRIGVAESQILVQAGQISQKVAISDFNGNTIASLINQTATTITLAASKIDMIGIVQVSRKLQLGKTQLFDGTDGPDEEKVISFRGSGVAIYSPANTDELVLEAFNEITFNSGRINFGDYRTIDFGVGSTVTGLYARFG